MSNNKYKIIDGIMTVIDDTDYGYFYDTEQDEYINKKDAINSSRNRNNKKDKLYLKDYETMQLKFTICSYVLVIIFSFAGTIYLYTKGWL